MNPLTRRKTLAVLGSATALPLQFGKAEATIPALSFLAVGDWGRGGQFRQKDVADQMAKTAAMNDSRFVISVGDNFYEDGVASVRDPAWTASFESVYSAPSLQVPWYVALGNHDYHGNSQAQLDYTHHSKRWRLPQRWYSFDETGPDSARLSVFIIDTSPMLSTYYADGAVKVKVGDQKPNVPVQLAWLDQALGTSNADWKIVIGHHPIYSGKSPKDATQAQIEGLHGYAGTPDLVAQIDPILQRHKVPLYMNGHDHDLQHVQHGDTHYVCTGAGSKMAETCGTVESDFCSLDSGFVHCTVTRERLRVAYRDYKGDMLHVVDIPRRT